jgi:hypothetical protein
MASLVNAALSAVAAAAFWSFLGYAVARHLLPRGLAFGAAPVLGWALHSAAALPIFTFAGFSPTAVLIVDLLCVLAGAVSLTMPSAKNDPAQAPNAPLWSYGAAAILALAPAAAIMPKFAGQEIYLADPIFDHSKIAIIDAMVRQGLPPVDPVYGAHFAPAHLAYYYLWHFSAAELALPLHVSSWNADIGLTWFTAFASLVLMMALAAWLANSSRAAILVIILAAAGSLRPALSWITGAHDLQPFIDSSIGFDGWLFQSAWVPQHLMAAACTVTAMLLIARYARQPSFPLLAALILTVVAGFESSTYVGGITFAIAALAAAPMLIAGIDRAHRLSFLAGLATAAVLAGCFAAPFVIDQAATVAARHDPYPVVVYPFEVLGEMFPDRLRRILDLPAYWLIELPVQFPALYPAGAIALAAMLRSAMPPEKKIALAGLACLAGAGSGAAWLLASTLGDNNDLELRAVLPAVMVLIIVIPAALLRSRWRLLVAVASLCGLLLGLTDTVKLVRSDIVGDYVEQAKLFARSPALWEAVRRYAGPGMRVANNPLYLQQLTPWPANISWALLADRSSCFAGRELALAFAPLPEARRETINAQFIRVFNGQGTPADIDQMAKVYGCNVVVVVPQDGAWTSDPFASSPDYRLAENQDGRWRIYVSNVR